MENKSLAQGVFLSLPPGFNLSKLRKRKKKRTIDSDSLDTWEIAFHKIWGVIETEMKEMNEKLFSKVLEQLVNHVDSIRKEPKKKELPSGSLPCELLLTGTNLPDHTSMMDALKKGLNRSVTPHIATLSSQDCNNVRGTVQNLVRQIVDSRAAETSDSEDIDDEDEAPEKRARVQKPALNMSTLAAWYKSNQTVEKQPVVVIIPDFESFSANVLSEVISLLSSYTDVVPLVLILGVATSPTAVYQALPRSVMSLLVVRLFHSEASPTFLNHVMEKILLSDKCPFRLGGRVMTFLIDIFIFYSFSVERFMQGFKYCMMEHFYRANHMIICCPESELDSAVAALTEPALENIRKLPSFQRHVESCELAERKKLLLDNNYAKEVILKQLKDLHAHTNDMLIVIKCLHILSKDLPGTPIGRHVREIYCRVTGSTIRSQPEFRQTLALLAMQARTELTTKISGVLDLLNIDTIMDILSEESNQFEPIITKLENLKRDMDLAASSGADGLTFEQIRKQINGLVDKELVGKFLSPPSSLPLHEILYFDDLPAVRRRISGAPKAAIHKALNNPHHYLQCHCCEVASLDPDAILKTFPDLSICYKLYLECNKTINLFDWLQSFAGVVKPEGVDQQVQARFTRAVSELQLLGFIKPSVAKIDHVTRLTFGNF